MNSAASSDERNLILRLSSICWNSWSFLVSRRVSMGPTCVKTIKRIGIKRRDRFQQVRFRIRKLTQTQTD